MGRFDDDEDAVVVAVAKPVQGHSAMAFKQRLGAYHAGGGVDGPVTCCGAALELWATPAPLSVDKVALAKGSLL
jgi:hypothetical protein